MKEIPWPVNGNKDPHFPGPNYDPELDHHRLTIRWRKEWVFVMDKKWHTLKEIEDHLRITTNTGGANLRAFRTADWGWNIVLKRRRPGNKDVWEYKLYFNPQGIKEWRDWKLRKMKIDPDTLGTHPAWIHPKYDDRGLKATEPGSRLARVRAMRRAGTLDLPDTDHVSKYI